MKQGIFAFVLSTLMLAPVAAPAQQEDDTGGLLVDFLEDTLSGDGRFIKVRGLDGALSSRATIEEIAVSDETGPWLTIRNAELDWNRLALLRGRFSVNALTAGEIVIERQPGAVEQPSDVPSAAAEPFSLPELPVAVELGEIRVDRLKLGEALAGVAAELQVAGTLSLADGSLNSELSVTRLDRPGDTLTLVSAYSNADRQIALDIQVQEEAGGLISTTLGIPGRPPLQLTAQGEGPVTDFTADIGLASDDVERVSGQVRLQGVSEQADTAQNGIAFTADLAGDVTPFLEAPFDPFFGANTQLRANGVSAADGRFVLSELQITSDALQVEGRASLDSDGALDLLNLRGRITPPDGNSVVLPVAGPRVSVRAASLAATFDRATDNGWTLGLVTEGLDTPDTQVSRAQISAFGTLEQDNGQKISGTVEAALSGLVFSDPAIARAAGDALALDGRFALVGDGLLRLDDFVLNGEDFRIDADTTIDGLDSGFGMDGTLRVDAGDLARFSDLAGRDLGGAATATLQGRGSPLGGAFDLTLNMDGQDLTSGMAELDPLLAGDSSISLGAMRDEKGLTLRRFVLATTALNATASAQVTEPGGILTLDGEARIEAASLAPFSALAGMDLSGAVSADLNGTGALQTRAFDLRVIARGNDIRTGRADLDPVTGGRTDLVLDARNDPRGLVIRELRLNGQALSAEVAATLTGLDSGAPVAIGRASARIPDLSRFSALARRDLTGSLTAQVAGQGDLATRMVDARLDLDGRNLSTGIEQVDALLGDGPLTLHLDGVGDAEGMDIHQLELRSSAITANAQGVLREAGGRLQFDALLDDLARVSPSVSGALTLRGDVKRTADGVNGEIRLDGPQSSYAVLDGDIHFNGGADVDFDARLERLQRFVPDFPGTLTAKGNARRADGMWTIAGDANGPGGLTTTLTGTFDEQQGTANLKANGRLNLGFANRFVSPNRIDGTAGFDLSLIGKPEIGALSGTISTTGSSMAIPAAGQSLTDIGGTVRIADSRATIELGAVSRAGGTVRISGPVALTPPFDGRVVVDINQLVLTDNVIYDSSVNGQLVLEGALARQSRLSGRILIGETNINIAAATGAAGAAPIPEIAHVGEPATVRATRVRAGLIGNGGSGGSKNGKGPTVALDVDVQAPNRIFVRGRGLNAELGGAIRIGGTAARVSPRGQIELIRGTLDILGRRLSLDKGIVALQGNLEPYIEFLSSTTTEDGQASIEISGPVDLPEIKVYSDPERPPEEALAMLLFGQRVSDLSPLTIAKMAASLAQLSGAGGDSTGGLRDSTGLDTIDIGTDANGGAQVGVGTYLGDNLYTDVTVNTQGETELNLNLDVTDSFTLRGTVDNQGETGIGIFFERDY